MKRLLRPISLMLTGIVAGCATPVRVEFDAQQNFARYYTWAWAPRSSHHIDAPHLDARRVHARVAARIEEEFRARGLRRTSHRRADLLVAYRLVVQRKSVRVRRVRTAQTLVGSFGVTYTATPVETEARSYESGYLVIGLARSDGRLVWVGELDRRARRPFEAHLEAAVTRVLGPFPPPSQTGGEAPLHPPPLDREQSMLAAMFGEVPGVHTQD